MSTLLSERRQPITAPKLRDRVPAQRATPRASASHEPAAAVPCRPVVAPRASWSLILGLIVATLREWRRRSVDAASSPGSTSGPCVTSASTPASSSTRCTSRSGGHLAFGEIDRRGGEPNARHGGSRGRPRTEFFACGKPVASEASDVLPGCWPRRRRVRVESVKCHREANDSVVMAAPKLPLRAMA